MERFFRASLLWMRISKASYLILCFYLFYQITTVSAEKIVLLDTYNSTTELRWKTHSNVDDDEIGWLEETYRGSEGLENRRAYVVCNVEHPNVDNWLRTPRIERNGANRLHVEITFTMRDCSEFPGNARSCKETFRLYGVQIDNGQELKEAWNSNHWDLIDAITTDLGRHSDHDSSSTSVNKEVRSYTVTKDAVYFAFRDSGACISILNVRVYYEICPEVMRSFVHFPRTITGSEAHSIIAVRGRCVANAKPSSVAKDPTYVCKATGSWDMLNGECKCSPGYLESIKHNTCIACVVGTYKADPGEGKCDVCPINSKSLSIGSAGCQCNEGFYRAEGESMHEGCSQPPSKPSRLLTTSVEQTSVSLEWDEPLALGNRKELWYRYKCPLCSTAKAIPSAETFIERKLQLSGLHPGTTYTVMIFAENDISKMVPEVRYALVEFTTKALSRIIVTDLRIEGVLDNGVTIAWTSPSISPKRQQQLMYEIEVKHNDTVSITETVHTYHTFSNLDPLYPYSFRVRAFTSDGWGLWSNVLWYQANSIDAATSHTLTTVDNNYNADEASGITDGALSFFEPPLWFWILILCLILSMILLILLFCSRRGRNRKHFSDCDGLDSYKNGTLTPDYNTPPPPQGLMQNLIRAKLGAPLISANSSQSAFYGNTRFKPYVDPTAYEDPNQALSEFANDVDPSLIRITEVIGSGEFGEVCKGIMQYQPRINGTDIAQVQTVAIKTLKPGSSEKAKSDFLMEASIMGQFEHENVVRLIGVVTKSEPIMIVTEYMENGSLDQFLRQNDDGFIGIGQIICMLKGIAAGMKYLTEKGYVHRDLAARNVLVDAELRCKIADFGLSRGLEGSIEQEYTTNGGKIPVRWTAPEAITHRKFTAASDVWSFGVVMWEVCSFGERPYWEWTNQKVISEVALGYRLPPPMDTPTALHNLMLRCWHIDRYKRPTFVQILQILEEYSRHPDLIFVGDANMSNVHASLSPFPSVVHSTGNLIRNKDPDTPSPPTTLPPTVSLEEFLGRIGLNHCLSKLSIAGVQTVSTLKRLGHIDLLSYGLTADEAQRISDALSRSLLTMHRTIDRSEARLFHTPQPPPRIINASGSLTSAGYAKNGFFV